MASQKQILVGAGVVGAVLFLPSLIGGSDETQGGGGGGVQSVGAVGLPAGLGGVADSSTKKESGTTTIYNFPDAPNLNITESNDLGIPTTKKESAIVGTSGTIYTGDAETDIKLLPKGESALDIPYFKKTSPDAPLIILKKEPTAPTTTIFSKILNFVKPTSWLPFF